MPALGNSTTNGLVPTRSITGGAIVHVGNEYEILAANGTATYIHDPMLIQPTANAADGTPNAIIWAEGANLLLGSMMAVKPVLTNLTLQYRVASTLQRCNVQDDPNVIFRIKSDGASASADIAQYASMEIIAGNTNTGVTGTLLDSSSISTVSTSLPLKIIRTQPALGNPVLNATSGSVYEVIIINHTFNT